MGVEAKKMANSIAAAGDNFGDRIKFWPERIKGFYRDVRTEMKKVTSPSRKEVQGTTTVVIITVFLFGLYFFLVDLAISNSLERMLHYFSRH
jgi:preprotein translocase subunit SecE